MHLWILFHSPFTRHLDIVYVSYNLKSMHELKSMLLKNSYKRWWYFQGLYFHGNTTSNGQTEREKEIISNGLAHKLMIYPKWFKPHISVRSKRNKFKKNGPQWGSCKQPSKHLFSVNTHTHTQNAHTAKKRIWICLVRCNRYTKISAKQ